jgi:signal transduction histidine kinase
VLQVGRRQAKAVLGGILLFVAYTASAKVGLKFDALNGIATTVWPASGIALAVLCRFGLRLWPAVALGALVVNLQAGAPFGPALVIAIGNTLEALVGSLLLRRLGFRHSMQRLRDVFVLVTAAALVSTAVSATVGTLAVWIWQGRPAEGYAEFWSVWWIGDAIGVLLIASALFTWSADLRLGRNYRVWGEALVVGGLLVFGSVLAFDGLFVPSVSEIVRGTYVVWPLLIWIALRMGPRGAASALVLVATVDIACTALGHGPFVRGSAHESLRLLQTYLAVTSVTIMTLAAAVAERRQAIRARDEFLSIASHELRTPLTALKLTLGRADRLVASPGSAPLPREELARTVVWSERQVERLERLVDDLLDVSRLRADRLPLQIEPVELDELVREAAGRFGEQLARAGSKLELDIRGPVVAACDRSRIDQVLTNLVANAIKYAPGTPVRISVEEESSRARVAVQDRGPGIPRGEPARIFEQYRRLASTKHVGGLGLGLYIGRQIAEAHGGSLTVRSATGQGAEFVLELPIWKGG